MEGRPAEEVDREASGQSVLPVPPVRAVPPSAAETISASFDLLVTASRQIRRASIYVGLLAVALIGPATLLFLALVRSEGGLEQAFLVFAPQRPFDPNYEPGIVNVLGLSGLAATVGGFALAFESQIMVVGILGGVAIGRQIALRDSLRLSRRVFWPVLGAALLVGILERIAGNIVSAIAAPRTVAAAEGVLVGQLLAETLVLAPFAFAMTGIVIGGVGPIETLKRSVRIARVRWRLALLVASAGTVVSIVQLFALGAGLDLVARLATALGLGLNGGAGAAAVTSIVILAAIVAVGSLILTVTAMIVAPQVVVFLRMTGYSEGLGRAWPPPDGTGSVERPRLVTRPMIVVIVLGGLAALAGFTEL